MMKTNMSTFNRPRRIFTIPPKKPMLLRDTTAPGATDCRGYTAPDPYRQSPPEALILRIPVLLPRKAGIFTQRNAPFLIALSIADIAPESVGKRFVPSGGTILGTYHPSEPLNP